MEVVGGAQRDVGGVLLVAGLGEKDVAEVPLGGGDTQWIVGVFGRVQATVGTYQGQVETAGTASVRAQ
ncbi:hypothetical protein [Streptomyces sp. NBC_01320]|uniref:hypothetical protein n=1 Tax=Streptomyces sp. NBC_01320 TaxID=2903824 RepID=UPI002E0F22CE|nr:hypothetical protein OG395_55780 [Streptomyces sp. NBC_01320]